MAAVRLLPLAKDLDKNKVTPGVLGFIVFAVLGVAVWMLMKSMNRHMRRVDFEERPDGADAEGTPEQSPAREPEQEKSEAGADTGGDAGGDGNGEREAEPAAAAASAAPASSGKSAGSAGSASAQQKDAPDARGTRPQDDGA